MPPDTLTPQERPGIQFSDEAITVTDQLNRDISTTESNIEDALEKGTSVVDIIKNS